MARALYRTQQLDDSQPVVIGGTPSDPIWTTRGELKMSPEDKLQLSHNLSLHHRRVHVEKVVSHIEGQFAQWFELSILGMAPKQVADAYVAGDTSSFESWLADQPLKCVTDGLTARIIRNGQEIAMTSARVDPLIESDVVVMLKAHQIVARGKGEA